MKPKACSCGTVYIECPISARIQDFGPNQPKKFIFECDDCHKTLSWPITQELLLAFMQYELKKCIEIAKRLTKLAGESHHEDNKQTQLSGDFSPCGTK